MKLGIIQGRLSEPVEGYQDCPANWTREFELLRELRLNHIEWIVTKENYHSKRNEEYRLVFFRGVRVILPPPLIGFVFISRRATPIVVLLFLSV